MQLRHLSYLVALAHEKHFARAAERCDISQPALSLAIKQLELELGVAIVLRSNRFAGFTPEGEALLAWARRVLREHETLIEQLQSNAGTLSGRIRLGVIPSATALSAKLVSAFGVKHPGVSFLDLEMTSVDMLRALHAFEIEAGITYIGDDSTKDVDVLAIASEKYVLVTPDDSPLADLREVPWASAASIPLCLLHRDMQNRQIIDSIFESVGARVSARVETDSMVGKYRYLQLGWSSIMPLSLVEWLRPPGNMRVIPLIEPTIEKALGLVMLGHPPSPTLVKALRFFAATLPELAVDV